jgi:hypothetical protein
LHEQFLEGQIVLLVKGLCELSTLTGNSIDGSEVSVVWQDSVIVDTAEEKKLALVEIDAGVRSKDEYRSQFMGETPEEAKAKIEAIGDNSNSFIQDLLKRRNTEEEEEIIETA